jgi:uncharacterized protein YcgI (DUF1989 family)
LTQKNWYPEHCQWDSGDTGELHPYAVFRAEINALVVSSACPQDMLPINNGITTGIPNYLGPSPWRQARAQLPS